MAVHNVIHKLCTKEWTKGREEKDATTYPSQRPTVPDKPRLTGAFVLPYRKKVRVTSILRAQPVVR